MQPADGKTLSMCGKACQCCTKPDKSLRYWFGPSRSRKSKWPGANGIVELSLFGFRNRLARAGVVTPRATKA